MRFLAVILFLCLLLNACQQETILKEKFNTEENRWVASDSMSVRFVVEDTSQVYDMEMNVVHAEDYGYQNLYVRIFTTFPSGKKQSSVTSLELAEKDGSWSGDCGGGTCEITLPLQQHFKFPEPGSYSWSIEPYMRIDTVAGIESIEVICKSIKE
jgi:gliding motility-associated lipoprotein GldH